MLGLILTTTGLSGGGEMVGRRTKLLITAVRSRQAAAA